MARVTGDFQSDVIRAYKGVLDFYYWRGIGVVRGWPRKPVLPRNPAVQAAGQDFRDNSRAISALPLELQVLTAEEVKDTAYTWKDAWTTTVYGHGLTWTLANDRPPTYPDNSDTMQVDLYHAPNTIVQNIPINSAAYITTIGEQFLVPFAVVPYTHYRVLSSSYSTQAGQTVSMDVAITATPTTPLHSPGPALTIPNAYAQRDSGWLSLDNIPAIDTLCSLILKGSNATVDMEHTMTTVLFARL